MPEIVAVPAPQVTDVWVVENHELEYLGLEPQPPVEIIVVRQTEAVALIDTGKGDQGVPGPMGPMGESVIPYFLDYDLEPRQGRGLYRFAFAAVLKGVSAHLRVPGEGSPTILDVNLNGTTVFPDQNDRPSIPAGTGDLPEISLNIPIASGDLLSVDVDDTGSTFGGEDLGVFIRFERA
jgi:hypothetical protein